MNSVHVCKYRKIPCFAVERNTGGVLSTDTTCRASRNMGVDEVGERSLQRDSIRCSCGFRFSLTQYGHRTEYGSSASVSTALEFIN